MKSVSDFLDEQNGGKEKPLIRLDPSVVQTSYRSPAESFMPQTADPYVISKYNEFDHETRDSLIQEIAQRVSEGLSRFKACELASYKGRTMDNRTLRFWMRQVPEYEKWIKDAEEDRRERLFDEIVDIPDDLHDELSSSEAGGDFLSSEDKIKLANLRVKSRQHVTAKADPIKFGGKVDQNKGSGVIIVWNEQRTEVDNSLSLEEILRRERDDREKIKRERLGNNQEQEDETGAEEVG